MKYFPVTYKDLLAHWKTCLEFLTKIGFHEHKPILAATTRYLHALDELCDQQDQHLEALTLRKKAETHYQALCIKLYEAEARATMVESSQAAALAILT